MAVSLLEVVKNLPFLLVDHNNFLLHFRLLCQNLDALHFLSGQSDRWVFHHCQVFLLCIGVHTEVVERLGR